MGFWSRERAAPGIPVTELKRLYLELGSLQKAADAANVDTGWLGRQLKAHDRRVAGSGSHYAGPERRKR